MRSEKGTVREKHRCEEVSVEGGSDVPPTPGLHYYSTFRVVARRTTAIGCQFRTAPGSSSGALQGRGRPERRPGQSSSRFFEMEVACGPPEEACGGGLLLRRRRARAARAMMMHPCPVAALQPVDEVSAPGVVPPLRCGEQGVRVDQRHARCVDPSVGSPRLPDHSGVVTR